MSKEEIDKKVKNPEICETFNKYFALVVIIVSLIIFIFFYFSENAFILLVLSGVFIFCLIALCLIEVVEESFIYVYTLFLTIIFIIFSILLTLCFSVPIAVDIQPPELKGNIILTNDTPNYSIVQFISLNNLGMKVDIDCTDEYIPDTIKAQFSYNKSPLNRGKKELINATLSIQNSTPSGRYIGFIKIQLTANDSPTTKFLIPHEEPIEKLIPINLNVTNKIAK